MSYNDSRGRPAGLLPLLAPLLMLLFVAIGCDSSTAPPSEQPEDTTTVAYKYNYQCAGCHGLNGLPRLASVSDLKGYDSAFSHFDSVLTDGPGLMPRFPQLDQSMRQRLYDYVRSSF
jgi:mono/diheme cytochrome c family protein